jgi:hypothetical protein
MQTKKKIRALSPSVLSPSPPFTHREKGDDWRGVPVAERIELFRVELALPHSPAAVALHWVAALI